MEFKKDEDLSDVHHWDTSIHIDLEKELFEGDLQGKNYFSIIENEEIEPLISNILDPNSGFNSTLELLNILQGDIIPNINELLDIPNFMFSIFTKFLQVQDNDIKHNILLVLVYLTMANLKENSDFLDEGFIKEVLNNYNTENNKLVCPFTNFLINLMSDRTIGIHFTEILFNNDFLTYILKILQKESRSAYEQYAINSLFIFTEIAVPQLLQFETEEFDQLYVNRILVYNEILQFLPNIYERSDNYTQDRIRWVICHLCDLSITRTFVLQSTFPHIFGKLIPSVEIDEFFPSIVNTANCLSSRIPEFFLNNYEPLIKKISSYFKATNDSSLELSEIAYFIEITIENQCFDDLNRKNIFSDLVKLYESNADHKSKKKIAKILVKSVSDALSLNEKPDWLDEAISDIIDAMEQFSEHRLAEVLMKINNWIGDDLEYISEIGRANEIQDILISLVDEYPEESPVNAAANMLLENEIFA
ncbi:hypothetical protein TVAG_133020 [Trichomonas vaginalis G3]|uniref:Uncharacterized protein n=1 Tax=Trichomonas vaginalis (strain ATCC PRA-98 / G3) TaxID=412133 RepID=A2EDI0_TRIV3|nr:hypothetical protein TVAGG3_0905610 [Trichomonas vaginalis G3]EAY09245.1 hypothetical protein TVAG_133020 [Trichomonas vaginalis G3]KAI5484027.1 hypothetical protein TVAGG3_0905610 [Trichomonas vaginalis G3]|eukprot:XP_001321468.1 hypothetical protein [Trichomonas vaginalis G3]